MRPAGDIRRALLFVASALHQPGRSATQAELIEHAGVGRDAAKHTLKNMVRAGSVHIPRTRRVPWRNRPVAEYAPGAASSAALPCDWSGLDMAWRTC